MRSRAGIQTTFYLCTIFLLGGFQTEAIARSTKCNVASKQLQAPIMDHHFHLVSPAGSKILHQEGADFPVVDGAKAVAVMNSAAVQKAVLLSDAYFFDSPNAIKLGYTYDDVKAENDWTAKQAERYPNRLVAFCGINPLSGHALAELTRCAKSRRFAGVKLHFDESQVDLLRREHVRKARAVFALADRFRLPVITHIGTQSNPPYGAQHAAIFVNELASAAPHVPVIVAHLWGGGAYADSILEVFARAMRTHPNLYFEMSGDALRVPKGSPESEAIVTRMRQIGLRRYLFGSDYPDFFGIQYAALWSTYAANSPLTIRELNSIACNALPTLRKWASR